MALRMKALGFDEPCLMYENFDERQLNPSEYEWFKSDNQDLTSFIKLPLFQQAFRWFREKYGLDSFCRQTNLDGRSYFKISKIETDEIIRGYSNFTSTYEEAELVCLTKLIEIVESK